jgi:hypothetical protein
MNLPRVLAVTKRPAELCANQPLLYAAGFQLVTAATLAAAHELAQGSAFRGVIVCMHSWSDAERQAIFSEMKSPYLPIMKCPGCIGCDESSGKVGTLDLLIPISSLIERMELTATHA